MGAAGAAPIEQVSYAVSFDYHALLTPYPIVYLSINNHMPLPFLLDTGTDFPLCITFDAAQKLHLNVTYKRSALDVNSNSVDPVIRVADVAFVLASSRKNSRNRFHIPRTNKDAIIIDWPVLQQIVDWPVRQQGVHGKPLAGIIGAGMFSASTIRLDFDAKRLTLFSQPPILVTTSTQIRVPMKKRGNHYFVTLSDGQRHTVEALLDTGCGTSELSATAAANLSVLKTFLQEGREDVGGTYRVHIAVLPLLQLGALTIRDIDIVYSDKRKSDVESILGMNVLARYRLTIDFARKQLFLEPALHAAARSRLRGFPVVACSLHGQQVMVDKVQPTSAAARAGLHIGDRLLEVDHIPLQGLPNGSIKSVLDGYGDTQAELLIKRAGQKHSLVYHRYSLAVAAVVVDFGAKLQLTSDSHLLVETVRPGSPAQEASLKQGDEILVVDTLPVASSDYERMLSAFSNPPVNPLPLTIQRKGEAQPRQILLNREPTMKAHQ